jgi:hypothetical protein
MKRPSFQFYPSDWLRDTALRSCSTGARGLWIDMICFMHEGNPYGYLKVGDKVILADNLCRMVGETLEVVEGWLSELEVAGVFDVDNGVICSRRMIRDEELRQKRAEGGKLGGNPALKVNLKVEKEVKQNPTPSSSSSSSSSINKKATGVACPPDVNEKIWADWIALRKAKKAVVTETVIVGARKEAEKIGWTLEQFLTEWCVRGSQGLKADWIKQPLVLNKSDIARVTVPGTNERDPALVKLDQDRKNTAPPSPEILAKIKEVLNK